MAKKDKYIFDGKVTSPFITGGINMANSMQRKNLLTSTIKVNYNIPKVGKDSITLVSKFNDKNPRFLLTRYADNFFDGYTPPFPFLLILCIIMQFFVSNMHCTLE